MPQGVDLRQYGHSDLEGGLAANVEALGEERRSLILPGDATAPPRAPAPVALALLDPPYGKGLGAKEAADLPDGFALRDDRRYGAARLLFIEHSVP